MNEREQLEDLDIFGKTLSNWTLNNGTGGSVLEKFVVEQGQTPGSL